MADFDEIKNAEEEEELEDSLITMTDEDGNEIEFEFVDLIEYNGNEYVVLLPADEDDDSGEVVILQLEDAGEETESYISVDDDATLEAVFGIFKEKFKDTFDFSEE